MRKEAENHPHGCTYPGCDLGPFTRPMLEAYAELLEQLPFIFKDIKALGNEADRIIRYYKDELED